MLSRRRRWQCRIVPASKNNDDSRLGVAIVGAGIGASHLAAYLDLRHSFDVRWLCDLNAGLAARLLEGPEAEGIATTDDFGRVLSDPAVDLVNICLPPNLHREAITRSLNEGKHVVCEKPLALSLAEFDEIAAAQLSSDRKVFPVFQYRFNPGVRRLASLCGSGVCGKLHAVSIETHWNRGAEYYKSQWRGKWSTEGGGAILGHAIHAHDIVHSILGPVVSAHAMLETRVNDIEVDDCAAISFRLRGGALATSSVTLGAASDTSRIHACFENVTVESGPAPQYDTDDWKFLSRGQADQADIDEATRLEAGSLPGYSGMFEEVRKELVGLDNHSVTLDDARSSIELCTAIYASDRSGRTVDLPIDPKNPIYAGWNPGSA